MEKLVLVLILLTGCSSTPYIKVDLGAKLEETNRVKSHPVSFTGEIGLEFGPITGGARHRSQPFTGWPFNDSKEYYVNEFFISYIKRFGSN